MSLGSVIGSIIGKKPAVTPAPVQSAPAPVATVTSKPASGTVKQRIAAAVASIADNAGPAAVIYVQDGKLTIGTFGASAPTVIKMLGEATTYVAAGLTTPVPAAGTAS